MVKHKPKTILTGLISIGIFFLCLFLVLKTVKDLKPLPPSLDPDIRNLKKYRYLDRNGFPLTVTYANDRNLHNILPLYKFPKFLQKTLIFSEDKNFFDHEGVDLLSKFKAIFSTIFLFKKLRGASTITEQVVRMIHPRPRTLWSKWLEGIEAVKFENNFSKQDLLEFYLNEVPFARNRRGFLEAAKMYFCRDLSTLDNFEIVTLIVLIKAPSALDNLQKPELVKKKILPLGLQLFKNRFLSKNEYETLKKGSFNLCKEKELPDVSHFISYINMNLQETADRSPDLTTTLDLNLQIKATLLLKERISKLKNRGIKNGALLVMDHLKDELLAYVVANLDRTRSTTSAINSALVPRQPGSALKPFLYAKCLEKGWTAATLIEDAPVTDLFGFGLHTYRNYSNIFYGAVTLRQVLGNSLNTPAIRAIRFIGNDNFLNFLHDLGFNNLKKSSDFYGDGLALGNGEVSLFELTRAYTVLARRGIFRPIKFLKDSHLSENPKRLLSEEVSSIISDILSDPSARSLEFGMNSILNFSSATAIKTGTSGDFRDSWTVAYNNRFTVGAWLGNLENSSTSGINGSTGPALVVRSLFNYLDEIESPKPLIKSKHLIKKEICLKNISDSKSCQKRTEYFIKEFEAEADMESFSDNKLNFIIPSKELILAMDPRIPDEFEWFRFELTAIDETNERINWYIDEKLVGTTKSKTFKWNLSRGRHTLKAKTIDKNNNILNVSDERVLLVR